MLARIVRYTSQYIDIIRDNFSRERGMTSTDVMELRAFIGFLYLAMPTEEISKSLRNFGDGIEMFN